MKIGIFSPYLDTLGGGEKYMLTAASCLSSKHEVFLFWDDKEILNKASLKFNIDLSKVKYFDNIFSPHINLVTRLLQTTKFDAIFYLSDGSIPLVFSKLYIHFQFPVEWVSTGGLMKKHKISRVKEFICNSNYTKEFIDRKFNVNSLVLYPPSYFKKDLPKVDHKEKKNYILNVGRLSKLPTGELFKKQDFIINSFKKLVDKGIKDWELILVVSFLEKDKNLVEELKKLSEKYLVTIYENISKKKLDEIYKKSKIYWHASGFGEDLGKSPEKAEHFGITTVEAMANGLVPVVINAGGQKEIVDNQSGFFFENERGLIEKTEVITRNEIMLEKMSKEAVKRVNQFTTDKFCEKLYGIFT